MVDWELDISISGTLQLLGSLSGGLKLSWAWHKICWVKNLLQPFLFNEQWRAQNPQYSIKIGYSWLVDEGVPVEWHPWVSNRVLLPKHSFFIWLTAQNRLLTQDRMFKMKIIQENRCFLCGVGEESIEHLYFECLFGRKCLALLSNWLQVDVPVNSVLLWWVRKKMKSLLIKQIIGAAITSMMYHIWHARNQSHVDQFVPRPERVFMSVRMDLLARVRSKNEMIKSNLARVWIDNCLSRVI
ncbi:uncharacterized protein LOC141641623 [Silene latifolia]|uniref:uncharacterized protein LOC141641623 n=1 Tax=Silene latifolia TaxID=37657 RepID=UPI003D787F56